MNILVVSESFIIRDSLGHQFEKVFLPADVRVVSNINDLDNKELSNLDLALIDIKDGNEYILERLSNIKNISKKLKIIIVDFNKDRELFLRTSKLGVDGYIVNISEEDEFIYIVKRVVNGKKYYDSELLQCVMDKPLSKETEKLTKKEFEVLRQVSKGLSNKEIADNLKVTDFTIKKHVSKILSKLKLRNRQDIVIYAKDNDILEEQSTYNA